MTEAGVPAVAIAVLAGGSGTRVGAARNKVYLPLCGRSVIIWSLRTAAGVSGLARLVLVVRAADRETVSDLLQAEAPELPVEIVEGGATRHDSELAALRHLAPAIRDGEIDVVLIHDGARPLAGRALMDRVARTAARFGGAVPGIEAGPVAEVDAAGGLRGPLSGTAVRVQTPQGFRAAELLAAYERSVADGFSGTDTAACIERYSDLPVHHVPGEARNIKITHADDFARATTLLDHP